MNGTTALIAALGSAVGAVLASWSLVVKARGEAAKPKQLLSRLWDWVVWAELHEDVPPSLAGEIRDEIEGDQPQ